MRRVLRTVASLAAGLAMAFSISIASESPAEAAPGCQLDFTSYTKVTQGTSGARARAAQCLLRSAGYNVTPDGSFSAADADKARSFQRATNLPATGMVAKRSWTALLSRGSRPKIGPGASGPSIQRLQRALTAAGRQVPTTGYYGSITRNAVTAYQRSRGYKATGTAGGRVWRDLQAGMVMAGSAPSAPTPPPAPVVSGSKGERALAFAKKQVGDSYRYGASGPNSWDCSGLTQGAWASVGVSLPHSSRAQYSRGVSVSRSNLRAGDLVFFYSPISHVGIYAGNGRIIHASQPGRPVGYIDISHMPYSGARRVG